MQASKLVDVTDWPQRILVIIAFIMWFNLAKMTILTAVVAVSHSCCNLAKLLME